MFSGVGGSDLVNWVVRGVGASHLPWGGQMLGWVLPGNIHPFPLGGTSQCLKEFLETQGLKILLDFKTKYVVQ